MRKPVWVLFFCLWPLLNFWALMEKEYSDITASRVIILWMVGALFASGVLYGLFRRFPRTKEQAAELASLAVTLFFLKKNVAALIWPGGVLFIIFYATVLCAAFLLFRYYKMSLKIFRVMAGVLVITSVMQLIHVQMVQMKDLSNPSSVPAPVSSITPKRQNNVYYFILDGYTRNDFLKKYFGFDNGSFSKFLSDRGFYYASKARSNYHITLPSVPALLRMNYHVRKEGQIENWEEYKNDLRRTFWLRNISDAPVFSEFQRRGYQLIYSNAYGIPISSVDQTVEVEGFSAAAMELVNLTPIPYLLNYANGKLGTMKHRFPQDPSAVIEKVHNLRNPFFFFIHVFSPHPPYVYRADCSSRDEYAFVLNPEDLDYIAEGTAEVYLEQLQCLNKQMSFAIERILEKDPGAIIGIQSDHGFPSPLPSAMRMESGLELSILFGIQNWIRIPGVNSDWLYSGISPVNMFRLIFGYLDDKKPDYLPDESYYIWTWGPREGEVIYNSRDSVDNK